MGLWNKLILVGLLAWTSTGIAETLTIYTNSNAKALEKALTPWAKSNGVTLAFVENSDYAKLKEELAKPEAKGDLLAVKDLIFLTDAASANLYQPMDKSIFQNKVDAAMTDPDGLWTALTFRARTLVYLNDDNGVTEDREIEESQLGAIEDISTESWADQLCLRGNSGTYNVALTAWWLAKYGEERTQQILEGLLGNRSYDFEIDDLIPLQSSDTESMKRMARGPCRVSISNHYYLAREKSRNPSFPIKVFFPKAEQGGSHANGQGVGILKSSANKSLAEGAIRALLEESAQSVLADEFDVYQFPAVTSVKPKSLIKDWGTPVISPVSWKEIGAQVEKARELMSKVGYN